MRLLGVLAWMLLCTAGISSRGTHAADASPPKKLKRSTAKRWDNVHEIVRSEIKSSTQKFLAERSQALSLPIEVDILLVGFDGDGGYGYQLNQRDLSELLGSASSESTICPTVWDTSEHSAICFNVNYMMLDSTKLHKGIDRIEAALKHNMYHVGDRSQDWPDGSRQVQVYEVDGDGEVEATVWDLLDEVYGHDNADRTRLQHHQIVVLNPNKARMSPNASPTQAADLSQQPSANFIEQWKRGNTSMQSIIDQEAGYLYRYRYRGRGSAASFVSQYNFVVVDVSAGPVSFGPMASPAGSVTPTGMPRLMPLLLRMTRELSTVTQPGTLQAHMLEGAVKGQAALFNGQMASVIASATRQLFASDIRAHDLHLLGGQRLLVPIVVIQDHGEELLYSDTHGISTEEVQLVLDELLPSFQDGVVTHATHSLHHHPQLAAALTKARMTRCHAVLAEPPDIGLHKNPHVMLDSKLLMRELRMLQDTLLFGMLASSSDYGGGRASYDYDHLDPPDAIKRGTQVLPVYVLSLERSPDQMLFDNGQLVAVGHDMVLVLQLMGTTSGYDVRGRVHSGHMVEGHQLAMDAAEQPTRHVVAGIAGALAGVVPPYQRYCQLERQVVEDWRWGVGAVPWGPYSNYSGISSIFSSSGHRNLLVTRVEAPLRRLQHALDRLDRFINKHLQGPFAYLADRKRHDEPTYGWSIAPRGLMPHHHLLDDLAKQHKAYDNSTKKPPAAPTKDAPPSPSPAVDTSMYEEGEPSEPAVELIVEQPILSPKVAERLEASLGSVGKSLEEIAWKLYLREWRDVEDLLPKLEDVVTAFTKAVDTDLHNAHEVVQCCAVVHAPKGSGTWLIVGVVMVLLGGFGIAAFVAIRNQRLYRPGMSRVRSGSMDRKNSGGLPRWSNSGLPR